MMNNRHIRLVRRSLLVLGALLLCGGLSAQGLRHSVCVVYPEFGEADSTLLATYARQLSRDGKAREARQVTAHLNGSFGSGVLTETCVLTNSHVVGCAATAKLVFYLHDKTLTFPHCEVLCCDNERDIAAIALPDSMQVLVPLSISDDSVNDGDDISAAGFPGLSNKPSWQLTRGSVSNAILTVDELPYAVIQHTAPIDPGSSGGPLLVKRDQRYVIVGLNTMKAFRRDGVGVAVPARILKEVLATLGTPEAKHNTDLTKYREYIAEREKKDEVERNRAGVDGDLRNRWLFTVSEDYYFNGEHMPSLSVEYFAPYYLSYGVTMGMPITPDLGLTGGFRFGAHVPVKLNANHYIVPRATIGLQIGGMFKQKVPIGYFPVRAGVDYRYELKKSTLVFGVEYVFRPQMNFGGSGSMFAMRHGISAHIGVAL